MIITNGKFAIELAFHRDRREGNPRRSHDHARCLLLAGSFKFVDFGRMLEGCLVHSIGERKRHQVPDEFARIVNIGVAKLRPDAEHLRLEASNAITRTAVAADIANSGRIQFARKELEYCDQKVTSATAGILRDLGKYRFSFR